MAQRDREWRTFDCMKLSPLQLAYHRVVELSVASRLEIDRDQPASALICSEMKASLNLHHDLEDDSAATTAWTTSLLLEFTPPDDDNSPYEFRVGLFGVFRCAKNLPPGLDAEKMVGINGTSVLYGIARELIQNLTGNALWGSLTLPTMSFTDFREMLPKNDSVEGTGSDIE